MSRGNSKAHANSWIGYCRLSRTKITGFKKKRIGHPSEKLSTDVPRATWKVILVSEIISPLILATILTIAYLFVKVSLFPFFTSLRWTHIKISQSFQTPSINALLRIAIIALGPIVFNAVLLITLFVISLFAGPLLGGCCGNLGSVMAGIAHLGSVIGMVAFFEFLWLLERWDISHAVLGMIATMACVKSLSVIC